MTSKYEAYAEFFGEVRAREWLLADIKRAKKKDKVRRLKEKISQMDSATIGEACKNVLLIELGKEPLRCSSKSSWELQNAIFHMFVLEMEY